MVIGIQIHQIGCINLLLAFQARARLFRMEIRCLTGVLEREYADVSEL